MKALFPVAAAVALALAASGWFFVGTRTGQDLLLERFVAAGLDRAAAPASRGAARIHVRHLFTIDRTRPRSGVRRGHRRRCALHRGCRNRLERRDAARRRAAAAASGHPAHPLSLGPHRRHRRLQPGFLGGRAAGAPADRRSGRRGAHRRGIQRSVRARPALPRCPSRRGSAPSRARRARGRRRLRPASSWSATGCGSPPFRSTTPRSSRPSATASTTAAVRLSSAAIR